MLPIRCFTCNKVIGRYNDAYEKYKNDLPTFFKIYNINRYCCMKIFMTHIDIFQYEPKISYGDNIKIRSGNIEKKIVKSE